jgi:hypothetical protein
MKICLLLTGTIAPSNVPNLVRNNCIEREKDYIKSISFWMSHEWPIVFVENSNFYSEALESIFLNTDHEYIKFTTKRSHLGKGAGEAEIIEYALENSNILKNSNIIVKVTGRLYIKNINQIISTFIERESSLIVNFRKNLFFADSRLIVATKNFFSNYLLQELNNIDESQCTFFEHIFAKAALRAIADGLKWNLPDRVIQYIGHSGTGDSEYRNSFLFIKKQNIIQKILSTLYNLDP